MKITAFAAALLLSTTCHVSSAASGACISIGGDGPLPNAVSGFLVKHAAAAGPLWGVSADGVAIIAVARFDSVDKTLADLIARMADTAPRVTARGTLSPRGDSFLPGKPMEICPAPDER